MAERRMPDRTDIALAIAVGLLALALYWRTLAPGLLPGDSGEFQFLARFAGHAHTPGYPVFVALAGLFARIPAGEIAFRVNLLSAVMAGVALANLYLATRHLGASRAGALAGAAALALSATWWSQAVIAEVYTAGAAVATGVLLATVLWWRTRRARHLFVAGLLGGLGMGMQVAIVLLLPVVIVLLLTARPARWTDWRAAVGGALSGLALALACFVAVDRAGGAHDIFATVYRPGAPLWGLAPGELDSPLERLRFLFGARQWRGAMFADPAAMMPGRTLAYLRVLLRDFSPVALPLAAIGAIVLLARERRVAAALLAGLAVHLLYVLNYGIWDIHNFYILGYLLLTPLIARGTDACAAAASRLPVSTARAARIAATAIVIAGLLVPVALPATGRLRSGEAAFSFIGMPGRAAARDWRERLRGAVRLLDENALLLASWDDLYPAMYVARIDAGRDDLRFAQADPFSARPDSSGGILPFVRGMLRERPVYATSPIPALERCGIRFDPVRAGESPGLYRVLDAPPGADPPRLDPGAPR